MNTHTVYNGVSHTHDACHVQFNSIHFDSEGEKKNQICVPDQITKLSNKQYFLCTHIFDVKDHRRRWPFAISFYDYCTCIGNEVKLMSCAVLIELLRKMSLPDYNICCEFHHGALTLLANLQCVQWPCRGRECKVTNVKKYQNSPIGKLTRHFLSRTCRMLFLSPTHTITYTKDQANARMKSNRQG